jgi:hypothetical protein
MSEIAITAGPFRFTARFETAKSPQTCAAFQKLLPYSESLIHVRWSGEACWIPLGEHQFGVGYEDATSFPAPGQVILYPGGMPGALSETEILVAYGPCRFASKAGQLAGNHFLTITEGLENLHLLGRLTLLEGKQPIRFGD